MVENGTRADIARKRFEDTNQLTAKHMIYVGTGDKEEVTLGKDKSYIYKTEGKNIISAINDATKDEAGIIDKAHSAETAVQATNAGTAKKIVSEDDGNPTIIKGKSDNNQSRIIPAERGKVDLGALNYEFNAVYATGFIGTADAAKDTDFSKTAFTIITLDNPSNLTYEGFYYIYFTKDSQNTNLGLIYWDGKNDSYSPIAVKLRNYSGTDNMLCDECFVHITTDGKIEIWKRTNEEVSEWLNITKVPGYTIYYKKIR